MSLYQIITLGVLIVLSGVFSGMETAVMSLNEAKVRALVKQKKRGSKTLYRVKKNTHKLLITILIGNNLVNIGSASLATVIFTELFGSAGLGIATGVMTFLILLFGEITPKTFASQNAEKISLIVARPLELLSIILSPVVFLFELISRFVSKILGSKEGEDLSEEELRTVVTMGARGGILNKEAAKMMHNVLEFKETKLSEIMTPKIGMQLIDGNKNLRKVLPFVIKTPYSRYPVYLKNKDNIIGILDVDDVLRFVKNSKLDSLVRRAARPPFIVNENKEIAKLLTEFDAKDQEMAIVVDDKNKVKGLVTIVDLLEEIVGDIFEEKHHVTGYIKKVSKNKSEVDADAPIVNINKELGLKIRGGKYETIEDFVEYKLKKPPKVGDRIRLKNVSIEVYKVKNSHVHSVKIIKYKSKK